MAVPLVEIQTPTALVASAKGICASDDDWGLFAEDRLEQGRKQALLVHARRCPECREVAELLSSVEWDRLDTAREPLDAVSDQELCELSFRSGENVVTAFRVAPLHWTSPGPTDNHSAGLCVRHAGFGRLAIAVLQANERLTLFVYSSELATTLRIAVNNLVYSSECDDRGWTCLGRTHARQIELSLIWTADETEQTWSLTKPVDLFEAEMALKVAGIDPFPVPNLPVDTLPGRVVPPMRAEPPQPSPPSPAAMPGTRRSKDCAERPQRERRIRRWWWAGNLALVMLAFVIWIGMLARGMLLGDSIDTCRLSATMRNLPRAFELWRDTNNRLRVTTDINRGHVLELVVEPDAELMQIPSAKAKEIGIEPDDHAPTVKRPAGNGQVVEGKIVQIDRVSVGNLTIRNVECLVTDDSQSSPPENHAQLGMSYLRHFDFTYAPDRGMLSLSEPYVYQ